MATLIIPYNGSGINVNWTSFENMAVDDSAYASKANQGISFCDLDTHILTDGDIITKVEIMFRGLNTQIGIKNYISAQLYIDGANIGLEQDTGYFPAASSGGMILYTFTDAAWDFDWTKADLDSGKIRLEAKQDGMPDSSNFQCEFVYITVTYTLDPTKTLFNTQNLSLTTSSFSQQIVATFGEKVLPYYTYFFNDPLVAFVVDAEFTTLDSIDLSNNGLTFATDGLLEDYGVAFIPKLVNTGKYYIEFYVGASKANPIFYGISGGDQGLNPNTSTRSHFANPGSFVRPRSGLIYRDGVSNQFDDIGTTFWADGDVAGIAIDMDNGMWWTHVNGTWLMGASLSEIESADDTNALHSGFSGNFRFMAEDASIFTNATDAFSIDFNFGQYPFVYALPAGFGVMRKDDIANFRTEHLNLTTFRTQPVESVSGIGRFFIGRQKIGGASGDKVVGFATKEIPLTTNTFTSSGDESVGFNTQTLTLSTNQFSPIETVSFNTQTLTLSADQFSTIDSANFNTRTLTLSTNQFSPIETETVSFNTQTLTLSADHSFPIENLVDQKLFLTAFVDAQGLSLAAQEEKLDAITILGLQGNAYDTPEDLASDYAGGDKTYILSFPTPGGSLDATANIQVINYEMLHYNDLTGATTGTIDLYEDGVFIRELFTDTANSGTVSGSVTFSVSELSDSTGADLELRVYAEEGSSAGGFRDITIITFLSWDAKLLSEEFNTQALTLSTNSFITFESESVSFNTNVLALTEQIFYVEAAVDFNIEVITLVENTFSTNEVIEFLETTEPITTNTFQSGVLVSFSTQSHTLSSNTFASDVDFDFNSQALSFAEKLFSGDEEHRFVRDTLIFVQKKFASDVVTEFSSTALSLSERTFVTVVDEVVPFTTNVLTLSTNQFASDESVDFNTNVISLSTEVFAIDKAVDFNTQVLTLSTSQFTVIIPTSIALTGTVTASIVEGDIVSGGKTIILTVSDNTFVSGTDFDNIRQSIINGLTSA